MHKDKYVCITLESVLIVFSIYIVNYLQHVYKRYTYLMMCVVNCIFDSRVVICEPGDAFIDVSGIDDI